jgi:pimeloyl-ACP methyl ester carboxylesterase
MIHALPGMGADHRMYPAPWETLPDFVAHDWIRHGGEKTLAEVAQSMSVARGIRDGDILVGSSLGGMVACEITKIRRIPTLYLVGSAVRKEEINTILSALHPLAQVAPIDWLRFSAGKVPLELVQMFSGIETSFVRAMCEAIFQWDGLGATETRVFRIHGKHDYVIPAPAQADLLLDGGHLVSITHAQACVEFIRANQVAVSVS